MRHIMIVEDDSKIAGLLKEHIQKYGYRVTLANQFDAILDSFLALQPDLVLLDVNLPSFDGYYWCRQIRTVSTCPVLFISARDGEMDQVMALENGGDDYLTKPFHYSVVMARIQSHLRRAYGEYSEKNEERVVELAGLRLFTERLELHLKEHKVLLTRKEGDLLEALMERAPRIVSRSFLLERLWDDQSYVDENTLNVNIARTRKKLLELGIEEALETVRSAGYRLNYPGEGGEKP
ncbi:DNA-binding response regulator [Paenibacillus oryzae]|uniref:DNA-binding response regulator n=1 Tax=Paenibacillus oryzae TaxID=1844972 RepID=A0A1A5YCQ6_9BACL|nr:response regulator transcription factor [Paenibacillus oryzae]OBR63180.1 DNA-binding response regulator [Paenibacillus oryzae]